MSQRRVFGLLIVVLGATCLVGCEGRRDSAVNSGSATSKVPAEEDSGAVERLPGEEAANSTEMTMAQVTYNPPSSDGYLGDQACAECHAEISELYARHPMSRSIVPVDVASERARLEGAEALVGGAQHHYRIAEREGQIWHTERMLDAAGNVVFEQGVPVTLAVGSGRRAIAYLSQHDDVLKMSPINWYTSESDYDFAPSHGLDDARRFDRRVNDDCLSCHAGRVNELARNASRFANPPMLQPAIGCENCHGPGAAHVAYQQDRVGRDAMENEQDPIVNPATLGHREREAVCYQCHLHSAGRLLCPERSHYDFRPGQPLDSVWTHLVKPSSVTDGGQTEAVAHVQQMHQSMCFQGSLERGDVNAMGCITCHDPHTVPSAGERLTYYRDRCLSCHGSGDCSSPQTQRQSVDDSCIACHMPARSITNVAHTSQTDHRILRQPDAGEIANVTSRKVAKTPGEIGAEDGGAGKAGLKLDFFWGAGATLPKWQRERALGMTQWLAGANRGGPPPMTILESLLPIANEHREDGPVQTVIGAFWMQYQAPQRALPFFARALEDPDVIENAQSNLLTINYLGRQWQRALELADALIAMDSSTARLHALRADILMQLGRPQEGFAAAETALELNPKLSPVRQWLIDQYRQASQTDRATEHERTLAAINAVLQQRENSP